MITIIFESHSTTIDNEAQLAAGWYDVELSELGIQQAKDLGARRKNDKIDIILCSDLQRSYNTAQIAFGNKHKIIKDARLRECNYGDLNRKPKDLVDSLKVEALAKPYPNGESYIDTTKRMQSFLDNVLEQYDGKTILIIGHRATQYGLEHLIKKLPLKKVITDSWEWQPGWTYYLA